MPKLSEKQREDILTVSGQRDEEIDYSDVPPVREVPAGAVRGRFCRGHAIYLTDELRAYFSNIARALRRQSYELNERNLFNLEYTDVLGIPFDFTAAPVVAPPQPPRETILVRAVRPERDQARAEDTSSGSAAQSALVKS